MRKTCEEFYMSTTTYYDTKKSNGKLRKYDNVMELKVPGEATVKRKSVKTEK